MDHRNKNIDPGSTQTPTNKRAEQSPSAVAPIFYLVLESCQLPHPVAEFSKDFRLLPAQQFPISHSAPRWVRILENKKVCI
jgi:hypothetical protein